MGDDKQTTDRLAWARDELAAVERSIPILEEDIMQRQADLRRELMKAKHLREWLAIEDQPNEE